MFTRAYRSALIIAVTLLSALSAFSGEDGYTFGQLLETCKQVSGSDARFLWASAEFLVQHDVEAHRDFPIWLSPDIGPGPARLSFAKARAAGLALRPVAETVRASLEWVRTLPASYQSDVGLPAKKEAKAVAAFKQLEHKA